MEYKVNQGLKEYKLTIKTEGTIIMFTLQSTSGETYSKGLTVEELRAVDQYFSSIVSADDALKVVDAALKTQKVAISGENGTLTIVFVFSDGITSRQAKILLGTSYESGFGATTTTSTNAFLTTNTEYTTNTETNYVNMGEYQHISTEESFGNIENIVPAPKLLNLEGQSIDIDKLLGVQNVTVTTTTIRKSHIPETAPIQIDSTQVTQEAIPTQTYNDSLPTITPAEPLETIAPVESLPTITPTESLPIITPAEPLPETTITETQATTDMKVLPAKYLPPKTLPAGADISHIMANIQVTETNEYNIGATDTSAQYTEVNAQATTDYNLQSIEVNEQATADFNTQSIEVNEQATTDYNIQSTDVNAQYTDVNDQYAEVNVETSNVNFETNNINTTGETNFDMNQYFNQQTTQIDQNIDPSLLRPSLKILEPQVTKTVLPAIGPQGETFNLDQIQTTNQITTMDTNIDTQFTTGQTGIETSAPIEAPITGSAQVEEMIEQKDEMKDQNIQIEGGDKPEDENVHEKELIELREENKRMKQELSELNSLREKVEEINELKAKVEQMNKMQEQIDELNALKQQAEETENLKKKIEELKAEKEEAKHEVEKEEEKQEVEKEESNQEIKVETKQETIQVKGDIISDIKELEMITRKINKMNKKITLNLLYKATVDSDSAAAFHEKCDEAKSSLVLVETQEGKRFGGFTTCSWEGDCIEKKDPDAFVFSLDKMLCYDNIKGEDAIGCYPKFGPIFMGCQIRIYNDSFTNGGTTYERGLNYQTEEDYELNGGEREFKVKDIEVYEVIVE
jgi:hypothetical protein